MKTIKHIAELLGVSKQAVHQKIKRKPLVNSLRQHTVNVDGVIHISDEGVDLIKQAFEIGVNRSRKQLDVDGLLDIIDRQQRTIDELTSALKTAVSVNAAFVQKDGLIEEKKGGKSVWGWFRRG